MPNPTPPKTDAEKIQALIEGVALKSKMGETLATLRVQWDAEGEVIGVVLDHHIGTRIMSLDLRDRSKEEPRFVRS